MNNMSGNNFGKKIHAKKSLGQHFLNNPRILKKIISIINPRPKDSFIEIGCGSGQLTSLLAQSGAAITAVETDRRLFEISKEKFAGFDNCTILKEDILKADFAEIAENLLCAKKKTIRITGNIPYNISSQILFMLIEHRKIISDITFLIQKELADRIAAKKGDSQYGYPSLAFGMFFDISKMYNVSGKSFSPPAKVESTVIKMKTLKMPLVSVKNEDNFLNFMKLCFSHRRKTIRNNIREIVEDDALKIIENKLTSACKLNFSSRAEEFDIFQFKKLYDMIV